MRKMWLLLAALLAVSVTSTAWAQEAEEDEQQPVLRLSWFQCDFRDGAGDAIEEEAETQVIPVWESIIADDMGIMNYGYIYHWWADEWNLGIWTIGESVADIIAAEGVADDRLEEQYGDGPSAFGKACGGGHRDGFYFMGPSTANDGE